MFHLGEPNARMNSDNVDKEVASFRRLFNLFSVHQNQSNCSLSAVAAVYCYCSILLVTPKLVNAYCNSLWLYGARFGLTDLFRLLFFLLTCERPNTKGLLQYLCEFCIPIVFSCHSVFMSNKCQQSYHDTAL